MNKYVYTQENPPLDADSLMLAETIFHNANGLLGVRSNFEEGYPPCKSDSIRGAYINGFYDIAPMPQAEKLYGLIEEKQCMVNVADVQEIRLFAGDFANFENEEEFCMFDGTVVSWARSLHMDEGVTVRTVRWRSAGGKELEIRSGRMASFVRPELFVIEYSVTALNFSGEIRLESGHIGDVKNYVNPADPRVAGEQFEHLVPLSAEIRDGVSFLETGTAKSELTVCTAVCHRLSKSRKDTGTAEGEGAESAALDVLPTYKTDGHRAYCCFRVPITEGETVTLTKYAVFCDSVRHDAPKDAAARILREAADMPLDALYREQRDYLAEFWRGADIVIDGDDELQAALNYNMYQLLQSAGRDSIGNIAAKGLSGEGYEGHYFWDTEMYMLPFFILNRPETARSLLMFRHRTLAHARENARILGHSRGALFPWRTIMGKECSGYFPSGTAQYHINGAVAHAVVSYYLATGDRDFLERYGAEILLETARLWLDVGHFYKGRFHIHAVTGPDEYTCMVNNNYYTNLAAQFNLRWAARVCREFGLGGADEPPAFEAAAGAMVLLYDEELGINPQDDSFLSKKVWDIEATPPGQFPLLLYNHPLMLYRYQVCKQPDTVLAHFIYEDAQDIETIRRSFEYYEKITTHDSSLSTCIFSIVASKLGLHAKAYEYFGDSAKLDLFNVHGNTKDGIHTASMGGAYMAIVFGFGGLRIKEDGIVFAPNLPEGWRSLAFNFRYRGRLYRCCVTGEGGEMVLVG